MRARIKHKTKADKETKIADAKQSTCKDYLTCEWLIKLLKHYRG
jgi:hypothetical protein